MKIKIKLHPNSSQEKIIKINENGTQGCNPKNLLEDFYKGHYEVWINEKPIDGKANAYVEKYLKKELGKQVKIISGFNSRIKYAQVQESCN